MREKKPAIFNKIHRHSREDKKNYLSMFLLLFLSVLFKGNFVFFSAPSHSPKHNMEWKEVLNRRKFRPFPSQAIDIHIHDFIPSIYSSKVIIVILKVFFFFEMLTLIWKFDKSEAIEWILKNGMYSLFHIDSINLSAFKRASDIDVCCKQFTSIRLTHLFIRITVNRTTSTFVFVSFSTHHISLLNSLEPNHSIKNLPWLFYVYLYLYVIYIKEPTYNWMELKSNIVTNFRGRCDLNHLLSCGTGFGEWNKRQNIFAYT